LHRARYLARRGAGQVEVGLSELVQPGDRILVVAHPRRQVGHEIGWRQRDGWPGGLRGSELLREHGFELVAPGVAQAEMGKKGRGQRFVFPHWLGKLARIFSKARRKSPVASSPERNARSAKGWSPCEKLLRRRAPPLVCRECRGNDVERNDR